MRTIGTKFERSHYQFDSTIVNAFYSPLTNTINFPAGMESFLFVRFPLFRFSAFPLFRYPRFLRFPRFPYPETNVLINITGILELPMFSTSFPTIMQYARLGYVIGHENTHGFDNNGRMWNSIGEYIPIMDEQSSDAFNTQAQCIVDQFDKYSVSSFFAFFAFFAFLGFRN